MSTSAIKVENLSKSFSSQILFEDASFQINPRERIGLVGRNGHGKTTLFRILVGEEQPSNGTITIPRNYRIGYVRQHLEFTRETVLQEGMRGLREEDHHKEWKVEKIIAVAEENARINRAIEAGGNWLRKVLDEKDPVATNDESEYVDILKSHNLKITPQRLAILKEMTIDNPIPILMVSGLEDDESVDKAFSAGATEYITKPICWPLLIHRLKNICAAIQAETNLIRAKQSADEANRAKTEFLANMSHELRTPMHAILSFASMGNDKVGVAPDDKLQRYFSRIEESGKRLLFMLNDLLDLSKLEAGKMSFLIDQGDLLAIVKKVEGECQSLLVEKELKLTIDGGGVSSKAWFDSDRILQVITNLLSNAIKFSPSNSEIIISFKDDSLTLDSGEKVNAVRLTVRDQGIGIPENELESVFDKFVQSSETNTGAGGTGLGLAICKHIVDFHSGNIFAENNSDKGASFHLVLPRNEIKE